MYKFIFGISSSSIQYPIQNTLGKSIMKRNVFFKLIFFLWCLNATFNNISVISSLSVLLVEETRGFGENHRPVAHYWQTLSHYVVYPALIGIRTSVVIGTDCTGSYKSNYHAITTMTAPTKEPRYLNNLLS